MGEKKILVVDDEPDTVAYITALLEDHSYQVLTAHNAEKGMELLEREKPDIALVDVMMPGASGLDLVLRVRKNATCANLPIIVITGKAEVLHDKCRSYLERYGVSPPEGILEKPFDPPALLKMVRRFLNERKE